MKRATIGTAALVQIIAVKTRLSYEVVEQVLAAYDDTVIAAANEGARVRTLGGLIARVDTKETSRRNPRTGELMVVPAKSKLVFKIPKKR
jgi:nucleoid DNA-binding protein